MRKLLIALLLQVPILVLAQNNFNLKGEVKNLTEGKNIYLIHITDQKEQLDSAKIIKGKFDFSLDLKSPSIAILMLDHSGNSLSDQQAPKDILRFFIEPGNVKITATDSIAKAKVSGLAIADIYSALNKSTSSIEDSLMALNQAFTLLPNTEKGKEEVVKNFQARYLGLLAQRQAKIAEFIVKHPTSYVSLFALSADLVTEDMDVALVDNAFNSLSADLKALPLAQNIAAKLELEKRTGLGVEAFDFEEKTADNIAVKLSDYKGQYVLLDFWASWCGPCRQENPTVVKAYETYKDKKFTVLGVSIDKNKEKWTEAVKKDGLVWTNLLDRSQDIANNYGINAIPKNFLIGPDGKIIAKNLRGEALLETLAELFANQK